jgi:transketolase
VQIGVTEIPACGTNDQVLKHHGLDAASLADRIASVVGERSPAFI